MTEPVARSTGPKPTAAIDPRRPIHLAVLVGASTALYAVSLAGVTALQSGTDQAAIDDASPVAAAADRLRDGHDQLEDAVTAAESRYARTAARYDALTADISAVEDSLQAYANRMAAVGGATKSLPSKMSLPTVARAVRSSASKPVVRSTTTASGK